jgi:hypothetical protein
MKLTRILLAGSSLICSLVSAAHNHNTINVIVSALPPPARVIVTPPRGHTRCYVTPPQWINRVWIPAHQECIYAGMSAAKTWISGYWGCLKVGPHGACGRWQWAPAHWMAEQPANLHGHSQPMTQTYGRGSREEHEHEHNQGHEIIVR